MNFILMHMHTRTGKSKQQHVTTTCISMLVGMTLVTMRQLTHIDGYTRAQDVEWSHNGQHAVTLKPALEQWPCHEAVLQHKHTQEGRVCEETAHQLGVWTGGEE